ncbi:MULTISPECIES: transglycosylase SLT domain-containing protein [Sorangium]|uniref:Murein transglycosylase n=1 Tax=Sorangium cellulosum TaxID=56 RepID=A0A4P2QRQ4_SORCE|nr:MULTISPECIES: transglycosylase SLT domain-containing protein [Sorangium]AUX32706.1 murein transglycosylase [Sorangium cellulosum]WCQ92082.1 lytic tail protein [Sorangium sp. Soce836]
MSWARRAALWTGLGALICMAGAAVGQAPSLRASCSAAYRAFRDPGLLDPARARAPTDVAPALACPPPAPVDDAPPAVTALLVREFQPAADEDLEDPDGATLSTLAMPDLDVPLTRRTMRFVRFFAQSEEGRAVFQRRFRRAGAYREIIERALREAGLPEDLLWVAAVESGFDPRAVSPAGAAGLWQFMPRTGEAYGLEQSEWIDARMSLTRATDAATAHLRDLYERFGRWDLALAAYNFGHEGVLRALAKVAAARDPEARGPIGLAELAQAGAVPKETADYVPQIVAFAIVAGNRARFGLDLPDVAPVAPLDLGEVAVPPGTRLRTIARAAGISTAALREHNPELLRDRVPPGRADHLIALPADRVARAMALFPAYLDHEELDEDEGDGLAGALPPRSAGGELALRDGSLPPRPVSLGRNRLPLFTPPGQAPAPMPLLGNPEALEAKLPIVMIGGGVGFRPAFEDDPLGLRSGRLAPASPFDAVEGPGARRALKGREAAIEKQIGLLAGLGLEQVQRFRLPNGIAVDLREDPAAPLVSISASVAVPARSAGDAGAAGPALASEARVAITVPPRDLEIGVDLVAARLRMLLDEASAGRVAELRRQASAASRRALELAPYGPSWLALGEALFPAGHPLEGTLLGARADAGAASELLLTESLRRERAAAQATIALSGDVSRAAVERALARSLQRVVAEPERPIGPHPREERIVLEDAVPSPRLLYGWIAPQEGGADEAPLRVAMEILTGPRVARLAKALVTEGQLASEVTGRLSLGAQASVAAVELTPAPSRSAAELEQRLDAELAALATSGPTWKELALAKALLKIELEKELARRAASAPPPASPRPITDLRLRAALDPGSLPRLLRALEEVEPADVRAVVARTFGREHRVSITTWPRGGPGVRGASPLATDVPASAAPPATSP